MNQLTITPQLLVLTDLSDASDLKLCQALKIAQKINAGIVVRYAPFVMQEMLPGGSLGYDTDTIWKHIYACQKAGGRNDQLTENLVFYGVKTPDH